MPRTMRATLLFARVASVDNSMLVGIVAVGADPC